MTAKKKLEQVPTPSEQGTASSIEPVHQSDVPGITASYQVGAVNTKKNLATALAKAQAECQNVVMNKVNPHFRSKYADLAAVRDAVIPAFTKHGLSIVQAPTTDGFSGFSLETRIMHQSGEELVFNFPLPPDVTKMQAVGSAISYARRYTLSALAGIASEEDDDGNAATNTNGGGQPAGGGSRGTAQSGGNAPGPAGGIVL